MATTPHGPRQKTQAGRCERVEIVFYLLLFKVFRPVASGCYKKDQLGIDFFSSSKVDCEGSRCEIKNNFVFLYWDGKGRTVLERIHPQSTLPCQSVFSFFIDALELVIPPSLSFLISSNGTLDSGPTFRKFRQTQGEERELCLEIITLYFAEVLVFPLWQLHELT